LCLRGKRRERNRNRKRRRKTTIFIFGILFVFLFGILHRMPFLYGMAYSFVFENNITMNDCQIPDQYLVLGRGEKKHDLHSLYYSMSFSFFCM